MLATIALSIGVIVAGLGIGAFLSALQSKGGNGSPRPTAAVTAPVVTPVPQPTRGPVVIATLVAHPTAQPTPRATPTPHPTPSPAPSPTLAPTPTAAPTSVSIATAVASPTAVAAATPLASASPRTPLVAQATAVPQTLRPTPAPPPSLVPSAQPATPRPAPTTEAEMPAASAAQNAVRRYLDALIAGNESAAYAALGKPVGDPSVQLSEEAFLDRTSRITAMRTRGTDATGATIEVRIASSRGTYDATYHVTNTPGGPIIDQHDYIKV